MRGFLDYECSYCGESLRIHRSHTRDEKFCNSLCAEHNLIFEIKEGIVDIDSIKSSDVNGYVKLNYHGFTFSEHRIAAGVCLGKPVPEDLRVHHQNGLTDDNDPGNLEIWTKNTRWHPKGQRVGDLIKYAKRVLEEFGHLEGSELCKTGVSIKELTSLENQN